MKKLITLSCIACYAITAQAQKTGDYQSIKSGNWTDITVWQRYNGSKWVAATGYPSSSDGVITILDLTNVTINTNLTIDQTIVDAGGQLTLAANYTVLLNNATGEDLIVNGRFDWSGGTIDGAGSMAATGTLYWSGGNLKVSLTNSGATMIGSVYLYPTSIFTNNGTVNWYYAGNIVFTGGKFNNNNVFNAYGNGTLYNSTGGGFFNNNKTGVFNVMCTEYITNNITFTNKGVMNLMMGSFYNYSGTFTSTKIMSFSGGGYQNRGVASIEKGAKITGSGYITLNYGTMSFNTGVILPAGINLNIYGGSILAGTGSVSLSGVLNWDYGTISVPLTIQSKGTAYFYNYSGYLKNATVTNDGTINWNGYDFRFYNGILVNNGEFNINCDEDITQYNTTYKGTFTNNASGTVVKKFVGTNTVGIAFANKGTVTGTGTFAFSANLTNNGTFDPGAGDSTGILTTGTDFKNSVLSIKITGPNPGLDFDRLVVNGNAAIGTSTLKVTSQGKVPAGAYVILSCTGTRTGTFSTTNLPAGYTITYKTNQVVLNVPASLAAEAAPETEDLSAKSLNTKLLSVFPNPASQNINVNFQSKNKSAVMQIFDENGKAVLQRTVTPAISNSLNISKLVPGSYVVQIKDGELTQSAKFVKQ